jgi:CRISPR-associated protein Cas6/Cse3/CasE subtype I-E
MKNNLSWTLFKSSIQARHINRYQLHKAFTRCVVDDSLPQEVRDRQIKEARVLFRVSEGPCNTAQIIVQSRVTPDWNRMLKQDVDILGKPVAEKVIDPQLLAGGIYRVKLDARPAKKIDGQRIFLYRTEEKRQWFCKKIEEFGGEVIQLFNKPIYFVDNKSQSGTLRAESFEAIVKLRDPDLLKKAMNSGIGHSKIMGFGMLVVLPA